MKRFTSFPKLSSDFWKIGGGLLVLVLIIVFAPVKKPAVQEVEKPPFNPSHAAYISAYSSGIISRDGSVKVRFATDLIPLTEIGKEVDKSLFSFSPSIEGKTVWVDTRTVEFKPADRLESGTVYNGEVDLSELYDTVPSSLSDFKFQVNTRMQEMDLQVDGIKPMSATNVGWQRVEGTIGIAEPEPRDQVEKIIEAKIDGQNRHIKWLHSENGLQHGFIIDSIQRQEKKGKVEIIYNGSYINVEKKGTDEIEVPAKGDFVLTSTTGKSDPEQVVLLQFSDPIDPAQKLDGLIRSKQTDFTFQIEGGTIKAFPSEKIT